MPRRIIFPEKGRVALENFELPEPGPVEIRVKTFYSLMSIGTESIILNQRYDPDTHFAQMFSFPQLQTGVQSVAVIEATGSEVSGFEPGDRIYMRMAHRSHHVLPADECSLIPENLDSKSACWATLAKTAFRACWAAPFGADQDILIIGAGAVGQMCIRWAALKSARSITVVDLSEFRLKHALDGGATQVLLGDIADMLGEVGRINDGKGPSIVVDVTGNAAVFKSALAAAAQFGKVMLLGDTGFPSRQCLSSDVMTKGLTIQATHESHDLDGWTQRRVDAHFFELLEQGQFDVSGLMTHEFSPTQCEQAYALANQQGEDVMGVLFNWQKDG